MTSECYGGPGKMIVSATIGRLPYNGGYESFDALCQSELGPTWKSSLLPEQDIQNFNQIQIDNSQFSPLILEDVNGKVWDYNATGMTYEDLLYTTFDIGSKGIPVSDGTFLLASPSPRVWMSYFFSSDTYSCQNYTSNIGSGAAGLMTETPFGGAKSFFTLFGCVFNNHLLCLNQSYAITEQEASPLNHYPGNDMAARIAYTVGKYNGNLKGLQGADKICNNEAALYGQDDVNWRALLFFLGQPGINLSNVTVNVTLFDVNGQLLSPLVNHATPFNWTFSAAQPWFPFMNGSLASHQLESYLGEPYDNCQDTGSNSYVYTYINDLTDCSCEGWGSNGTDDTLSFVGGTWPITPPLIDSTQLEGARCNQFHHLICITDAYKTTPPTTPPPTEPPINLFPWVGWIVVGIILVLFAMAMLSLYTN